MMPKTFSVSFIKSFKCVDVTYNDVVIQATWGTIMGEILNVVADYEGDLLSVSIQLLEV